MADMLTDGLAIHAEWIKADLSQTVVYRRGSSSVSIQAMRCGQILRVSDRLGNTKVERPDADFIFTTGDLDFGAGVVEPIAGDTIDQTIGAVVKRFELMPVNNGSEPAWRYIENETMIRCHTKFIETV